jgi:hypothetical protein
MHGCSGALGVQVAGVQAVHQPGEHIRGDLVADVADERGDGEPGDRVSHRYPAATRASPARARGSSSSPLPGSQPRRFPPATAALTAALAATGMTVPTGDDADAIGRIRTLMPPLHDPPQTLRG